MKHLWPISTTLALLAFVSVSNSADTTKTEANVLAAKPKTESATPVQIAKAKRIATVADTSKSAVGKPSIVGSKSCDDLKTRIEAEIKAKGVAHPVLTVTPAADVKEGKVVGSCGGGSQKIVYTKG